MDALRKDTDFVNKGVRLKSVSIVICLGHVPPRAGRGSGEPWETIKMKELWRHSQGTHTSHSLMLL